MIRFSWDPAKARANLRKHGVTFSDAKLVFDDPYAITTQDRLTSGELRWKTIGVARGIVLLVVAHTYEFEDEEGGNEEIRIISARRASAQERREYEER